MRFLTGTFTTLALLASAFSPANAAPSQGAHGVTVRPADGETVVAGAPFPFEYAPANACHDGYTPIGVYIGREAPSFEKDVQDNGHLRPGSFIFQFGDWLIPNFGLPPSQPPPPPPAIFLPEFPNVANNTKLYLTVVETSIDCPPGPPAVSPKYGLETTSVVYVTLV
ncbi:hypothetical protein DICSQDRAFT_173001 [Dichomitus squalens LYAD-421 SS1]|uniref:Phosphatidylglycerol/phosphatidylinositol transfer protein n=1 Tax=Dichomitus squalens (strain LYAD-421) TaxID=732165 RepID=R7SQL4_DICSQ|nr:uncharacterized protein DICSQDRAFT_173001 [Dichomitus squalens LYAD-421 SS1]EJF58489.1 hypothetical protein DICSQDRAFT_173001 [Dichomitus squalens LYAD-421 SS1]